MSEDDTQDDLRGSGKPTHEHIIRVREYLRRKGKVPTGRCINDNKAVRPTFVMVKKLGWKTSVSTVQRVLSDYDDNVDECFDKIDDKVMKEALIDAQRKTGDRLADERKRNKNRPLLTKTDIVLADPNLISTVSELVKEENSSAALAAREDRVRMALNIIIGERMAATPGLLLLDMRGAAELLDAITESSKLSGGGAQIDVRAPTAAERKAMVDEADALPMKDITPAAKSALAMSVELWRKKKNGSAKTS